MKRLALFSASFATILFLAGPLVQAQRPGGRGGPGGGQGAGGPGAGGMGGRGQGGGMRGQQGGPQQTPPLLRVFDTDNDGELSPAEIDAAAVALRKLDQNQDGRLSADELRPSGQGAPGGQAGGRGAGGPGGRPGQQSGPVQQGGAGQQRGPGQRGGGGGERGGQGMSRGGPGGGAGAGGGRGPGGGGRGGDPAQADAAFASQLMAFDADKDGMLRQSELPEHMHQAFALADADKTGNLDEAERLVLASQFRRNKLQPGGENLEMKNRPTQGRRPGGEN